MAEDINLDGQRIIVVEDDYLLASDLCSDLRTSGATVLGPAPTPFYAMQLIGPEKRRRVNAAILDINLHGLKVYDLADMLLERGVPFVFATAYAADSIPERFNQAPVLQNLLDRKQLLIQLAQLIRRPPPKVARALPPLERSLHEPEVHFARALARNLIHTWAAGVRQGTEPEHEHLLDGELL
jgi:CheY-like chemotaxis protein